MKANNPYWFKNKNLICAGSEKEFWQILSSSGMKGPLTERLGIFPCKIFLIMFLIQDALQWRKAPPNYIIKQSVVILVKQEKLMYSSNLFLSHIKKKKDIFLT